MPHAQSFRVGLATDSAGKYHYMQIIYSLRYISSIQRKCTALMFVNIHGSLELALADPIAPPHLSVARRPGRCVGRSDPDSQQYFQQIISQQYQNV
jgi:hypothetical protein